MKDWKEKCKDKDATYKKEVRNLEVKVNDWKGKHNKEVDWNKKLSIRLKRSEVLHEFLAPTLGSKKETEV